MFKYLLNSLHFQSIYLSIYSSYALRPAELAHIVHGMNIYNVYMHDKSPTANECWWPPQLNTHLLHADESVVYFSNF